MLYATAIAASYMHMPGTLLPLILIEVLPAISTAAADGSITGKLGYDAVDRGLRHIRQSSCDIFRRAAPLLI